MIDSLVLLDTEKERYELLAFSGGCLYVIVLVLVSCGGVTLLSLVSAAALVLGLGFVGRLFLVRGLRLGRLVPCRGPEEGLHEEAGLSNDVECVLICGFPIVGAITPLFESMSQIVLNVALGDELLQSTPEVVQLILLPLGLL